MASQIFTDWIQQVHDEIAEGARSEGCEVDFYPWQANPAKADAPDPGHPGDTDQDGHATTHLAEPHVASRMPLYMLFKRMWHPARRYALFLLLVGLAGSFLLPNLYSRVGLFGAVILLWFHLWRESHEAMHGKLDGMSDRLNEALRPRPVRTLRKFSNFPLCELQIKAECRTILSSGVDLDLELMVIAGRYSWVFFRECLLDLCKQYPARKIDFQIALCTADCLERWGARDWARRVEHNASEIESFASDHCPKNLCIHIYRYDNIPQSHGVLINHRVMFKGRTEWFPTTKPGQLDLQVGNRPYILIRVDDIDGRDEIATFHSWLAAARARFMAPRLDGPFSPYLTVSGDDQERVA